MTAEMAMQHGGGEGLKKAFWQSVVFHVSLAAAIVGWGWWNSAFILGEEDGGGTTVSVQAVDSIPLVSRGPANPVANDTKATLPQEETPKPQPKAKEPEPEDAEPLPTMAKAKLPAMVKNPLPNFKQQLKENQLTSKTAPALSSPMLQPLPGSGSMGSNIEAIMGDKFGAYAKQVRDITAANWHHDKVDQSGGAPEATVRYVLLRNGSVRNVRIVKHSATGGFDDSVIDAVQDSKYPPLPVGFDRDSIEVEFTFQLKR